MQPAHRTGPIRRLTPARGPVQYRFMNRSTGNVRLRLGAGLVTCAIAAVPCPTAAADKTCSLGKILEVPITMNGLRPTIPATINGREAKFILDSGAFWSTMSAATAAEYGLKTRPVFGFFVKGIGGDTHADLTTVKDFAFAGVPLKNLEFVVGGSDFGRAGLLGQNFLQHFDVEYDFAHGAVRLFRTEHCDHATMAYWLTGNQQFSELSIDAFDPLSARTAGSAYVNGIKIRVMFDTGAATSMLSSKAAARAGVKLDSPGVSAAGYTTGIGSGTVKAYVGTFASFKIGDNEEIKHAKLLIVDTDLPNSDMLLGEDFFISHRVFVANKEHKLFLSYNGGAVFDLRPGPHAPSPATSTAASTAGSDAGSPPEAAPAASAATEVAAAPPPPNAGELARQGAALAARRDYDGAVANLTKAIEASPDESEYYLERANAYWAGGHGDLALPDFDRAIELKPDAPEPHLRRAEFEFAKKDAVAAQTDLDAVDRLVAPTADARFTLGMLYETHDRPAEAIAQFTSWINAHPEDARLGRALAGRCWSRALLNRDLKDALRDCEQPMHKSVKTDPGYAPLYVRRALVRLRLGDYDKAIRDCSDALQLQPSNATARYLRGIAEARKNQAAESAADLAEANRLAPKTAERFASYGIAP
jgi:tetratricopeptide (TPR) repeat protein